MAEKRHILRDWLMVDVWLHWPARARSYDTGPLRARTRAPSPLLQHKCVDCAVQGEARGGQKKRGDGKGQGEAALLGGRKESARKEKDRKGGGKRHRDQSIKE